MSTAPAASRRTFIQRLFGAAALNAAVYEEVEADRAATRQAVAVVLLAGLAAGIGLGGASGRGLAGIPLQIILSLAAWIAWAAITFQIGARLLAEQKTRADLGELLRTLGFAASPGLLAVLAILPGLAAPVFTLITVWMLLAMVIAVRQALDYTSTMRAVVVCVLGLLLIAGLTVLFGLALQTSVS